MTETAGLGRIEKADLREAWPYEAADFTPWLGDHVSEPGAALGTGTRTGIRRSSGRDIVTGFVGSRHRTKRTTDRTVIIQKQLDSTDRDHLAKLLTNAGGCDANVIVWVVHKNSAGSPMSTCALHTVIDP